MDKREVRTVQSIRRAMQLLSLFAPHRTGGPQRTRWSVSELARETGLHKSIVARFMATLALDGFVVQDPETKAYSIGPQAFAVGTAYEPYRVLNQVARPVMEDLTARCGHASYLGVPAGNHYVFLVAIESQRSIRVTIPVGENRPYHTGAIGKVLLAGMPDARIRDIVGPGPLARMTPHTLTSVDDVLAQIAGVRATGLALNREESILGAGSVAVGIYDASGECIAGLAIVYPTHVVTDAEIAALVDPVRAAGAAISQRLGGPAARAAQAAAG